MSTQHYLIVLVISLYGASLAQRASHLALHSSLFGSYGTIKYDYTSLTALTLSIGS